MSHLITINEIAMENTQENKGEIILYQPDETTRLNVLFEQRTVWLSLQQISELFNRDKSVISRHIKNIFIEKELVYDSVVAKNATTATDGKIYQVEYYNLDVIISVGYRVKSIQGTLFRQWATSKLTDILLNKTINYQRFERLEERLTEAEKKINFIVKTSLPPIQGIFYNGQIFDAYKFANDLIRLADKRIILIDNYVDDSVLTMLDNRKENVAALIYTKSISKKLQLDIEKHNAQYQQIEVLQFSNSHDRFLILDDSVYLIGASLKDLGKKMFAFSKLEIKADEFLTHSISK